MRSTASRGSPLRSCARRPLLVTVVTDEPSWSPARPAAREPREWPLSEGIGRYVVAGGEPLVVEDARTRPELRDSGEVAYAGVPLVDADGYVLGADRRDRRRATHMERGRSGAAARLRGARRGRARAPCRAPGRAPAQRAAAAAPRDERGDDHRGRPRGAARRDRRRLHRHVRRRRRGARAVRRPRSPGATRAPRPARRRSPGGPPRRGLRRSRRHEPAGAWRSPTSRRRTSPAPTCCGRRTCARCSPRR